MTFPHQRYNQDMPQELTAADFPFPVEPKTEEELREFLDAANREIESLRAILQADTEEIARLRQDVRQLKAQTDQLLTEVRALLTSMDALRQMEGSRRAEIRA